MVYTKSESMHRAQFPQERSIDSLVEGVDEKKEKIGFLTHVVKHIKELQKKMIERIGSRGVNVGIDLVDSGLSSERSSELHKKNSLSLQSLIQKSKEKKYHEGALFLGDIYKESYQIKDFLQEEGLGEDFSMVSVDSFVSRVSKYKVFDLNVLCGAGFQHSFSKDTSKKGYVLHTKGEVCESKSMEMLQKEMRWCLFFEKDNERAKVVSELGGDLRSMREMFEYYGQGLNKEVFRDFLLSLDLTREHTVIRFLGVLRALSVINNPQRLLDLRKVTLSLNVQGEIGMYFREKKRVLLDPNLLEVESVAAGLLHELGHYVDGTLSEKERGAYVDAERIFNDLTDEIDRYDFFAGPFGDHRGFGSGVASGRLESQFTKEFHEFFAETFKDFMLGQKQNMFTHVEKNFHGRVRDLYLELIQTLEDLFKSTGFETSPEPEVANEPEVGFGDGLNIDKVQQLSFLDVPASLREADRQHFYKYPIGDIYKSILKDGVEGENESHLKRLRKSFAFFSNKEGLRQRVKDVVCAALLKKGIMCD